MIMCQAQYRFTSCKKCTAAVWDIANGGGYACMRAEGTEIFISSVQFYSKLKTAVRNNAYLKL